MSLPIKSVISGTGSSRSVQRKPPSAAHREVDRRESTAEKPIGLARQIRLRIHGLALGMTLGLGTIFIGQGCAAAGQ